MLDTTEVNALTGALEMVALGFAVFPLRPDTKDGYYHKSWTEAATLDPARVRSWPDGCNYGAWCKGFIVLDVDVADPDVDGLASLMELEGPNGEQLPTTRIHQSARGGLHYIFHGPDVSNSDRGLGEGINVRSGGGYIVAAGSTFQGKPYTVANPAPIAEAPQWLIDRLVIAADTTRKEAPEHVEVDSHSALQRAGDWLLAQPASIKGGRDNDVFAAACKLRDLGVTEPVAAELIYDMYASRAIPPFERGETERAVASAYKYAQNEAGSDAIEAHFDVLPDDIVPAPEAVQPIFKWASRWAGKAPEPTAYVIDKLVPKGEVTLFTSDGGVGKSFLTQIMMCHVAGGVPCFGLEVEQGEAAGFFGEDKDNVLHSRQLGICKAYGLDPDAIGERTAPTAMTGEDRVLWSNKRKTSQLARIEKFAASTPGLKLLVIDNVAQVFTDNEIIRGEVTQFLTALGDIAAQYDLAIILIHHRSRASRGDNTNPGSGSTAWNANVRSSLLLTAKDDTITLVQNKANHGAKAAPTELRFEGGSWVPLIGGRSHECLQVTAELAEAALIAGETLCTTTRGRHTAGGYLEKKQQGTDFTKREIETALQALKGTLLIEIEIDNKGTQTKQYRLSEKADSPPAVQNPDSADSPPAVAPTLPKASKYG